MQNYAEKKWNPFPNLSVVKIMQNNATIDSKYIS